MLGGRGDPGPPLPRRQEAAVDSRPGSNEISSAYASNRWPQPLVTQTLESPAPKAKHSMIQVQWVGDVYFYDFYGINLNIGHSVVSYLSRNYGWKKK